MIWEVFRQEARERPHVHCGNVHAPDREMAKQFSVVQHGRRKPTTSLWVAPQPKVVGVSPDEAPTDGVDGETVWELFRQDQPGDYHTHCGDVSATDAESAKRVATAEFDDEPHSVWAVRSEYVGAVTTGEVTFGGTTDKSYRFAQTYDLTPASAELEASESEQVDAELRRGGL